MKKPIYANCVWSVFEDAMFVSDKMQERNGTSTHYPTISCKAYDERLLLVINDLVGLKDKQNSFQQDIRIYLGLKQAARLSKYIKKQYKQVPSIDAAENLPSWGSNNDNKGAVAIIGFDLGSVTLAYIIGEQIIAGTNEDRRSKAVAYYSGSNPKEADKYEVVLQIGTSDVTVGDIAKQIEAGELPNSELSIPPSWNNTKGNVVSATIVIEMKGWGLGRFATAIDECIAAIDIEKRGNEQNA